MNKRGKAWPFFVVGILIIAFSLTAIFGVSYQYGDTKHTYIKSASDIRFGIDIRGGVDVTFMPEGDIDATPEQMTAAQTASPTMKATSTATKTASSSVSPGKPGSRTLTPRPPSTRSAPRRRWFSAKVPRWTGLRSSAATR